MNRNGDLDNRPVPRVLVHLDVFSKAPEPEEEPTTLRARLARMLRPAVTIQKERVADPLILSGLWRWADQRNVVLEAFAYGVTDREVQGYLDALEIHQQHPFRTGLGVKDPSTMVADLPFRREVVGVCDVPERGMRYGSWWLDPAMIY